MNLFFLARRNLAWIFGNERGRGLGFGGEGRRRRKKEEEEEGRIN